jgi:type IV secretion system protein VirD4
MWGPSHQHRRPPGRSGVRRLLAVAAVLVVAFELFAHRLLAQGFVGAAGSTLHTLTAAALVLAAGVVLRRVLPYALAFLSSRRRTPAARLGSRLAGAPDPADAVRVHAQALGGGAFLGFSSRGGWTTADPEHAVLVLGPPRSGKTSAVVIPALLADSGAAVSTSTKRDVLDATWRTRSGLGQVWLFDPLGGSEKPPPGARQLSWSPVAAAPNWDEALLIARAMSAAAPAGQGTSHEGHWRERSTALLAPLLLAANLGGLTVGDVLRWVLRHELDPARALLEDADEPVAGDVLAGIGRTDARERSSILSASAGVLSAYNARGARRAAATPNFDPSRFVSGADTIYVTAPAHRQALCAPLVVGLLEQIRHAAYAREEARFAAPVLMCLDELANIAPIHDLPALVSEAGGQGLHVLACLQDLSQARQRWGESAADGLLSLFQTKLVLDGIADRRTLEALSVSLGEYDRRVVSHSLGRNESEHFFSTQQSTSNESVSYSTSRQRVLSPGEIARLPSGRGLLLRGTRWELLHLAPWHQNEPWRTLATLSPPGPAPRCGPPPG